MEAGVIWHAVERQLSTYFGAERIRARPDVPGCSPPQDLAVRA
jgi:hypothetical protein